MSHYSFMCSGILMSYTAARMNEVAFDETLNANSLFFQVEYLSYIARLAIYIRDTSK